MASYTYFAVELGDEHALGCKCCRFSSGTDLPVPKTLTNDEAADLARNFSHQIFADFTQLNAILKRFEEVIQKRWMKKGESKRRAILLEAWPDMATTHRPDFVGFRKAFKNTPRSRTMLSKAYLWPYINLEDLLQRHLLLLFINSRGRNMPDKFISADIEAAHLGKGWQFDAERNPEGPNSILDPVKHKDGVSVLALHGEHGPRSYGKMVHRNGSEPMTKSAFMYHPGLGLLGLEIQQGIYDFVLKCATSILHDHTPDQFFLDPHKPTPKVPYQSPSDKWSSFAIHTLEAPYRVPQMLDLERIKDLVSAKTSSAEDHLWLLREDPGYFAATLQDWKEHDIITVRHSCSHCYNVVASRMITDAFCSWFLWDHISRCLQQLPPLEDQLKRANSESLRLPRQEEATWAEILEVVDFLIYEPITALRMGVPPSPRLRNCFNLPDKPSVDKLTFSWSMKRKISDPERRVTGLIHAIVDTEQRHLHSLNHIMQEFQYMMDTDKASNELVDPWINSQIADLALLSELKLRIEGLQPWQTSWKIRKIHKTGIVQHHIETLVRIVEIDVRDCIFCVCTELGFDLMVNPLDGRLDYPVTKAHTRENVTQMRRAERELAKFWTQLDCDLKATSGKSLTVLMESRQSQPRQKHRTLPWKEPVKPSTPTAKTAVLQEIDKNVVIPHAASFTKPEVNLTTPKTKIKTRGAAAPSPAVTEPAPQTPPPDVEQVPEPAIKKVVVSKRAFKALDALVPAPNASSHQHAEVAWNELLLAMDEIGLSPEKLYGSVWVFKPREDGKCKVDVSRSISFHEPKEVRRGHKIPTNMVRTFGRRLKHAYGWVDGMFVCE